MNVERIAQVSATLLNEKQKKTVEKILTLIEENAGITQEELAQKIGLSRRGVEWNLNNLKKLGIIVRINGRKTGYWEITGQTGHSER